MEFPLSFVLNTGTIREGGRHWQAVYFDVERNIYFFDSYGRRPMMQFIAFFENVINHDNPQRKLTCRGRMQEITREIQAFNTKVCGEYCIYFLHVMSTVKQPKNGERVMLDSFPPPITEVRHKEIRDELGNYRQFYLNDEFVKDWVQSRYNYYKIKTIFVDREK